MLIESILGNITTSTDLTKAVNNADLVIEAIVEKVNAKQELFKQIESNVPRYIFI